MKFKNKSDRINLRINPEVKEQAESIFDELGIKTSDAINIFLKKVIMCNGFPFDLTLSKPNKTTLQAMNDAFNGEGQEFDNINDAFRELNNIAKEAKLELRK